MLPKLEFVSEDVGKLRNDFRCNVFPVLVTVVRVVFFNAYLEPMRSPDALLHAITRGSTAIC